MVGPANPIGEMTDFRVREFLKMNPLDFYVYMFEEDPNGFIQKVNKVLAIMGMSSIEKEELAVYQVKKVAQILFEK